MLDRNRIEQLLDGFGVDYYRSVHAMEWIFVYQGGYVTLTLQPESNGDYLLVRTQELVSVKFLSPEEASRLWRAAMMLNEQLMLGRFTGATSIHFEHAMFVPSDEVLTRSSFWVTLCCVVTLSLTGTDRLSHLSRQLDSSHQVKT